MSNLPSGWRFPPDYQDPVDDGYRPSARPAVLAFITTAIICLAAYGLLRLIAG